MPPSSSPGLHLPVEVLFCSGAEHVCLVAEPVCPGAEPAWNGRPHGGHPAGTPTKELASSSQVSLNETNEFISS